MSSNGTLIPLERPTGEVVGHALVDAPDAEWLGRWNWRLQTLGYAVRYGKTRRPNRRTVCFAMHRVITGLEPGDPREVDHINGDRLDNRRSNLRVCSRAENGQNIHVVGGCSPYRGVHRHGGKWRAMVKIGGRSHHLGHFETEIDAASAAEEFRQQYMPFAQAQPLDQKAKAA